MIWVGIVTSFLSYLWNREEFAKALGTAKIIYLNVCEEVKHFKRNLSVAWIDYRKAFDSVPHDWLLEILSVIWAPQHIQTFLRRVIPLWSTTLRVGYGQKQQTSSQIRIKRAVFQGDSLSPLLFCLSLVPLSHLLGRTAGYHPDPPRSRLSSMKVTHLFYMDDLKIYSSSKSMLNVSLDVVFMFSSDICMSFGLDKCAVLHVIGGKECSGDTQELQDTSVYLSSLGLDPYVYIYIGLRRRLLPCHAEMKCRVST